MVKLAFSEGAKGYAEVEGILRVACQLRPTAGSIQLAEQLERQALAHLAGDEEEIGRMHDLIAHERSSLAARAVAVWHRFWGPSSREMELSTQRGDALERAERAERSAFEALREMTRAERELEAANEELQMLRRRIEQRQDPGPAPRG